MTSVSSLVRISLRIESLLISLITRKDVIIIEDDPYFFLQEGPYTPKAQRKMSEVDSDEEYLRKLAPSFLKSVLACDFHVWLVNDSFHSFDYQGRVIRLDTFSKVRFLQYV